MSDEWKKVSGKLDKCDEFTVEGEFYIKGQPRPNINQDSYWAIVTGHIRGELYKVEDKDGGVFEVERSRIRLRKRHVVCFSHVSDDKKHDIFAMQHFSTAELEWLEEYTKEEFANNIPEVKITHLHIHSDNAGQYFKSFGVIEYFTSLILDHGGASDCM